MCTCLSCLARVHCDGYCDSSLYMQAGRAATVVVYCEVRGTRQNLLGYGIIRDKAVKDSLATAAAAAAVHHHNQSITGSSPWRTD